MENGFSLERIARLVADLEQELARAPGDSPKVHALREEITRLKATLAGTESSPSEMSDQLHGVRSRLDELVASVEGEVLKDTPYLTDLGRILGLI